MVSTLIFSNDLPSLASKEAILPIDLQRIPQWCPYRYVWEDRRQKFTKPPIANTPDGLFSYSQPDTICRTYQDAFDYVDWDMALVTWQGKQAPCVGFVFPSKPCGIVCFDIDEIERRNGDKIRPVLPDGSLHPYAQDLLREIDSYAEYSPSGEGLHIWVLGDSTLRNKIYDFMGISEIEVYAVNGYVTVTGWHIPGTPDTINRRQSIVEKMSIHKQTQQVRRPLTEKKLAQQAPIKITNPVCKQILAGAMTPVCKRILSAAMKKQRFADLYGCVDRAVITEYGYKSVSEAINAVAMSLATRCRRNEKLMKEILLAAPLLHLKPEIFEGRRLDREIKVACEKISFELRFIPWGRPKKSFETRVIQLLKRKGEATREQIRQAIRQQYPSAEFQRAEIKRLLLAGVIRRKKRCGFNQPFVLCDPQI